jgi:hypothetical protein
MFRISLLLLLLFLSFPQAGCYAQDSRKASENPRITAESSDPYSYDFGRVKQGEVVKHIFVFKNESPKRLNIKDINTSCGCTVSKVEKKNLSAGEATLMEVKFNTKGYSGQIQQYIYVHTDSLDNPLLRFIIKAEIIKSK